MNLNTHSFRIGAASALSSAGVPESAIQILGRWASNSYRTYIRIPNLTIRNACLQLAALPSPLCYQTDNSSLNSFLPAFLNKEHGNGHQ